MTGPVLTASQCSALQTQLRAERSRLARQRDALERTLAALVEGADVEPADDEHDPDGTTAYERAQVASLAALATAHLAELDAALARVTSEDFGLCQHCDQPIGLARLEAVLGTRHCVRCAAAGARRPGR